ncbi:hypothetical protein KBD49_03525 [Myxococcota bacterium]|jgi:hypothetical protein|nr:hypothetical protein [Myxococcota bacterium]
MERGSLEKGLESLVAEGLRLHVLDRVLARPEVTRNLSPEALDRLKRKVLDRLARSEEEGRADRETALAAIRGLRAAAGPLGDVLATLWRFAGESHGGAGTPGSGTAARGEEESAEDASGPGEKP